MRKQKFKSSSPQIKKSSICKMKQSQEIEGNEFLENPEMFSNVEQISDLIWKGSYGNKQKKVGKWIAFWKKQLLNSVGGQSYIIISPLNYQEGQKQGLWKDLFLNYKNIIKSVSQIFEFGEYYNGLRIGRWSYIYKNEKMYLQQIIINQNGNYKQPSKIKVELRFYACYT